MTTPTDAARAPRLTIAHVRRAIERAGGTMEEDHGYRDMRTLQAVSPDGMRWAGNGCVHIRIEWSRGPGSADFNRDSYNATLAILSDGLEQIPENERYLYDESE